MEELKQKISDLTIKNLSLEKKLKELQDKMEEFETSSESNFDYDGSGPDGRVNGSFYCYVCSGHITWYYDEDQPFECSTCENEVCKNCNNSSCDHCGEGCCEECYKKYFGHCSQNCIDITKK